MKNRRVRKQVTDNLDRRIEEVKRRVSQSMSDTRYPNDKCRGLQKKLATLQKVKKILRSI